MTITEKGIWRLQSAQNVGGRKDQQDSVYCEKGIINGKNALLGVVADGMGGMKNGGLFSRTATEYYRDHFHAFAEACQDPRLLLLFLAWGANRQTHCLYEKNEPGGTTLLSALLIDERLFFLSVGDSRIYLFRWNERIRDYTFVQLNREHVLGGVLDEKAWMGDISFEDAECNLYRQTLTSCIGEKTIRRIDMLRSPVRLLRDDKIMIMSDGILHALSEIELLSTLKRGVKTEVDIIVQNAADKKLPLQDNISLVVIEKL